MDQIIIQDLEVFYRVGVPAAERTKAQRLLVTVAMDHDFSAAAKNDNLKKTIDYHAVSVRLANFGKRRNWKLIETLAVDMAEMILREFKPQRVSIEIKKFILPQTRHVAVRITRPTDWEFELGRRLDRCVAGKGHTAEEVQALHEKLSAEGR